MKNGLLQRVLADESIHSHVPSLSESMHPVLRLPVCVGVPVLVNQDHRGGSHQIESQPSSTGRQEERGDVLVLGELSDKFGSDVNRSRPIEADILQFRHMEVEGRLEQVQAEGELGEEEDLLSCLLVLFAELQHAAKLCRLEKTCRRDAEVLQGGKVQNQLMQLEVRHAPHELLHTMPRVACVAVHPVVQESDHALNFVISKQVLHQQRVVADSPQSGQE
mmetsp:Transcript_47116/g.92980  ORF Transcript_47116/g.92980 Transcript_47116/m.92980 type:complete len:220 (-) Transcript_47116:275-934(-)